MREEADIVHENATHWVHCKGVGRFEVYRKTTTHSVRCATFHFSHDASYALFRAIADADSRDAACLA
ncbi:hypothetical protein [Pandoraea faecigallinarum]|uniref:hypothetical protein n=1 Tax=Pandoraea faecigallinarum TaxID=656179 RepID=UPI0012F4C295|nr:hypothetical protein [Pandoraea faecigallinarum]